MSLSRRGLLTGLGAIIAAPAIVRAASLMPVRGIVMDVPRADYYHLDAIYWISGDGRMWTMSSGFEIAA